MDQTQQKALNALEPFILLSKSANSPRAAADLVTQATSAPNTYVFAELLQTPNIQSLQTASPEYASRFTLLQIFAWGTWSDYTSQQQTLPPLYPAQSTKLRQLSLLTLSTTPQALTYHHLLTALSLPTTRALEDLVISSIYAGLLVAKLDTLGQCVDVSSVAPLRDLRPGSIPHMISVLEDWDGRCGGVLGEIEEKVREVRRRAQEERRRERENGKQVNKLMDEGGKVKAVGKRGVVDEIGEEMDVDDGIGGGRTRTSKRGGKFMGLGKKFGGGG